MNLDTKTPEFQRAWAKIIAQAWADESFKERLISEPIQILREHGIDVPEGTHLTIDQAPVASFFDDKLAAKNYVMAAAAGAGSPPSGPWSQSGSSESIGGGSSLIATICGTVSTSGTFGVGPSGASSQPIGQPLAGGSTSGTAGSAGSLGTVCGTAACVFCVGSAGTAAVAPSGASSQPLFQPIAGASCVGSAGTIGSLGTFCGTAGTVATSGTAGSKAP